MPRAYSDDLRVRILDAFEAGGGNLRELASRFRVSWGYTRKIRAQQVRTGEKTRRPQQRHGFASRVDERAREQLRAWVGEQPDRTAAELRERLAAIGAPVCPSRVVQILQEMGLRRKKNAARV